MRPPYVASYFFSEDRFARVTPGMTPDDVRDLLGPPLFRQRGQDGTDYWQYSVTPTAEASTGGVPKYTELTVTFDRGGHAMGRGGSTHINPIDPKTGQYRLLGPRPPARPQRLDRWELPMVQGEAPRLGTAGEAWVIQVMAERCGPCGQQRPVAEAMVARQSAMNGLVLVSVDEDEHALLKYVKGHDLREPIARLTGSTLAGFDRQKGIPQYAVLRDGYIWWFDFALYADDPDRMRDLEWFIRQQDPARLAAAPVRQGGLAKGSGVIVIEQ